MRIHLLLFLISFSVLAHGQETNISSRQLSEKEVDSIFTENLKKELDIEFSIYRIYEFNDLAGKHYIVMTENMIPCESCGECGNNIRAYCFKYDKGTFNIEWSLKDFILEEGNEWSEENCISFWTKYFELDDYDGDGIVDPIVIYGTNGINGTSDGRIKILVYHHGKKRAIRHQNGTLDFQRNTQVDKLFYELPQSIQSRVRKIMIEITDNDHGIFPSGWKEKMDNKTLKFDEN